jgi:putative ABC transport system permease protein
MSLLHRLASVLRWMFNRNKAEADLDDEVQAFLEMAAEDAGRDGAAPDEARRLAALQLGGAEQVKERVRTGRHGGRLDEVARDVRYALRQLRRTPSFSVIAIATLALGIGGTTAMFSAFDAVLIRPLPYAEADRLVMIWDDMGGKDITSRHNPPPAEWIEWRRLNTVFTDLACSQPGEPTISGDGEPEQIPARKVTWTFWSVLGVRPALGRVFTEAEDNASVRVVVISHGLWQRRFGGRSDVVGRKMSLDDQPYEVIGVMPQDFYFMPSREIDIWMPASFPAWMRTNFAWHDAHIIARLKPGVTLQQARDSMAALSLQVTAKDFRGRSSYLCAKRSPAGHEWR